MEVVMYLALMLLALAQAPADARPVTVEIRIVDFDVYPHPKLVERYALAPFPAVDDKRYPELIAELERIDKPIAELTTSVPVRPLAPSDVNLKTDSATYALNIAVKAKPNGQYSVITKVKCSKKRASGDSTIATSVGADVAPETPQPFTLCLGGLRMVRESGGKTEGSHVLIFMEISVTEIKTDGK